MLNLSMIVFVCVLEFSSVSVHAAAPSKSMQQKRKLPPHRQLTASRPRSKMSSAYMPQQPRRKVSSYQWESGNQVEPLVTAGARSYLGDSGTQIKDGGGGTLSQLGVGFVYGSGIGLLVAEMMSDHDHVRQTAATCAGLIVLRLPWFHPKKSSRWSAIGTYFGVAVGFLGLYSKAIGHVINGFPEKIALSGRYSAATDDKFIIDIRDLFPNKKAGPRR